LGNLPTEVALARAQELGLNLVEVNPMAKPPVCKIMDYGKFKYEEKKRTNEAKKKQVVVKVKEIKLRPKTEDHDYETKVRHVREFLEEGNKAKITIMFRGREITHREIGTRVLDDVVQDLKDVAVVEQTPRLEGKQMFMILGPNSKVAQRARDAQRLALAAAEKEKAIRDGTDGRPPSDEKSAEEKPADEKPAEEKAQVEVAPPPPAAPAAAEAPKP
jgi:translation initiation factor IF-3